MTHKAKPRPLAGGAGEGTVGKLIEPNYRSETPTRVENYWLFVDADGFQHTYGPDRPPGKGWWSPAEEGCQHYVRSARRRRTRS
jgi:hypothetical protein